MYLYHTVKNTANQNTGKSLYIGWSNTQPSHHSLRIFCIDCVGHCIFDGMV